MTQADLFRLGPTPPRMLEILAALHADDPDRWVPRRLILQNYWLFQEPEVFHFARGNLMLTGQNESGKSTILVTAITLVLDMVLTPDRVDTMGSSDRSIRYYLIGKDDATEDAPLYHRERTAYVALELERGSSGQFRTIGIGLRTSRDWANQKVERWGFVMDGARRVAVDFDLHTGEPPRPLRPGELRDRLGTHGQVFHNDPAGYKKAINEALFGFQTVEEYERFLEMLHVVRTPKLGEGLSPRKVEAYLKESLPPIRTDAVQDASAVFENLDRIEAELDALRQQIRAADELEPAQLDAVLAAARLAAAAYRDASKEHRGRKRAHDDLLSRLESARAEVARQTEVREGLSAERSGLRGRLDIVEERHRSHGAFDIERRLDEAKKELGDADAALRALREDRQKALKRLEDERARAAADAKTWERERDRMGGRLDALAESARAAFWPSLEQRAVLSRDALRGMTVQGTEAPAADLARSAIAGEVRERRGVLSAVLAAHDTLGQAERRLDEHRRASDVAGREFAAADERYRAAARLAESARGEAKDALSAWRADVAELPVADDVLAAVFGEVDRYDSAGRRPASVLAPLQPAHDEAREALRTAAEELGIRRRRLRDEVAEVDERLRRLAAEPQVEPERTPAQEAARRLLREHGIPHAPLFAAVDLGPALAGDAELSSRIESALDESGLLDALVIPASETARVRSLLDGHGLGDRWIAPRLSDAADVAHDAARDADGEAEADGWLVPVATAELGADDVRAAIRAAVGAVQADGAWRLGPLHGRAAEPAEARVRYLGETARREERQRRIDQARRQLADLREALAAADKEAEEVRAREGALAREWRAAHELPQLQTLHDRIQGVRRDEHERERRRGIAAMAAEAVEKATGEVQERAAALDRATDAAPHLKGRPRAEVDAAARALDDVERTAREIGDATERMDDVRRSHAERTRAADEHFRQSEELSPRIAQADERARTFDAQIATLEDALSTASVGREELAEQIRALRGRLEEIARKDEAARDKHTDATASIRIFSEQEPDYATQLQSASLKLQAAEAELQKRIGAYPTLEEYASAAQERGPARAMQLLLSDVDAEKVEDEARRAREALQAAYLRASTAFPEMSPTLEGDVVWFAHEHGRVRLDELARELEDRRARNEALLEEEDRRLIEQLMLRNVVDAIRDAVKNTRHWVSDINGILGGMRLFKGGIMRLVWEVRPRETADAFDPRRLDELLSQRGISLDEARREELLDIFRTMVSDIRRRNRENELLEDYRTALLRMVDYTQWYTLSVQRRDDAGRWMPLTRRLYGQGSGGRRTLDLLLPLIAAVSARLASADRAAPRLVGFDEAFAGVDDRNAAEIYALLGELGFCWIMATEKTTGLGPEVRGSATYELLTDGATVAPTLSLWDGARRLEFVGDELLGVTTPRALGASDAS